MQGIIHMYSILLLLQKVKVFACCLIMLWIFGDAVESGTF
jgi:hypothetical protein